MPQIEFTERFLKEYDGLEKRIQKKVQKQLRLLAEDPTHASLRSKPVEGARGIYEASVDMYYRMTYERLPGDRLLMRVVGLHDDALKNP
jgi:mRNA-degrading endonuclease RelE of RelBE toxin-antitoxin system